MSFIDPILDQPTNPVKVRPAISKPFAERNGARQWLFQFDLPAAGGGVLWATGSHSLSELSATVNEFNSGGPRA